MVTDGRTTRQEVIPGWDQPAVEATSVAVVGGGPAGCFAAAGAAVMGFGAVPWVCAPEPVTDRLADHLIGPDGSVVAIPVDPRSEMELEWAIGPAGVILICSDEPRLQELGTAVGRSRGVPAFIAAGAGTEPAGPRQHPAPEMALAALQVDAARDVACPMTGVPPPGALALPDDLPRGPVPGPVVLMGAGGIGTWAGVAAVAAGFDRLVVIDDDRIEHSNLNRQLLYREDDARLGRMKAEVAAAALGRLAPSGSFVPRVMRIQAGNGVRATQAGDGDSSLAELLRPLRPAAMVSALDNAAARLGAMEAARSLGVPLVHAGTDWFAADVYCQVPGGPSLDEQMLGALTVAAAHEQGGRGRGCAGAYVVPCMMAAAMAVRRLCELTAGGGAPARPHPATPPPMHWRAGALPVERAHR